MKSRRDFLKKASYVAPAIISLKAVPSFANSGSNRTNSETPFYDLGPGCSSNQFGIGDAEFVRDRHNLCP